MAGSSFVALQLKKQKVSGSNERKCCRDGLGAKKGKLSATKSVGFASMSNQNFCVDFEKISQVSRKVKKTHSQLQFIGAKISGNVVFNSKQKQPIPGTDEKSQFFVCGSRVRGCVNTYKVIVAFSQWQKQKRRYSHVSLW